MFKKRFLWLMIIVAFVLCASGLFAQAPAGPEKVMIYSGESLKVQLKGDIRLNMVQNQYDVYGDTYQLWVNNQKWGYAIASYSSYKAFTQIGTSALWLPYSAALRRGSLNFDVRQSKFAVSVDGPGILGGKSFGYLEFDFNGGYGATSGNVSRQPVPRLRNVYAGLAWDKEMFGAKLTFGQYTSLMTPVLAFPVSLAFYPWFERGVLFDWDQGIMLSFRIGTPKINLLIDADITRAKAGNDTGNSLYPGQGQIIVRTPLANYSAGTTLAGSSISDERGNGEASMRPAWHGRIAVNINPVSVFGLTLAVQGHYYTEHAQLLHANLVNYGISWPSYVVQAADVPSKSLGAQAKLSVWIFTIQGAGWIGENMDNFTAAFGTGYRESLSGMKNLADKGRGGYCQFYIVGPKVGIPIILFVGMGQELKYNNKRIANATPVTALFGLAAAYGYPITDWSPSVANYYMSAGGVMANSEVSGGLWLYLNQYMKIGYEFGQMVTKYKGVTGTSASQVHRLTMSYTF
jgi:hypothetical protein